MGDKCDWFCLIDGEYCDKEDGHKGEHQGSGIPVRSFGGNECVWTVLP